jgi:hypothetical protein
MRRRRKRKTLQPSGKKVKTTEQRDTRRNDLLPVVSGREMEG